MCRKPTQWWVSGDLLPAWRWSQKQSRGLKRGRSLKPVIDDGWGTSLQRLCVEFRSFSDTPRLLMCVGVQVYREGATMWTSFPWSQTSFIFYCISPHSFTYRSPTGYPLTLVFWAGPLPGPSPNWISGLFGCLGSPPPKQFIEFLRFGRKVIMPLSVCRIPQEPLQTHPEGSKAAREGSLCNLLISV